jgi:hypothetical protein
MTTTFFQPLIRDLTKKAILKDKIAFQNARQQGPSIQVFYVNMFIDSLKRV